MVVACGGKGDVRQQRGTPEPAPVPARHPATVVQEVSVQVGPHRVHIPGFLASFAFLAPFPDGTAKLGWNSDRHLHVTPLNKQLQRSGNDWVLRNHVLAQLLAIDDGSLIVAAIPYLNSLFNSFQTPLAVDIIKLDRSGKQIYRTRITGGQGTAAGKVWHSYGVTSGVRLAWNGRQLGVFLKVSRNFAKPGAKADTHQGDLFVVLDERGAEVTARRQLWSASHSNNQRLLLGPKGQMLTLTVGDAYPFGILYIDRETKRRAIVWPDKDQRTREIIRRSRTVVGAGSLCGATRRGRSLFATIETSRRLPYDPYRAKGDVLLVRFDESGAVQKRVWLTDTRSNTERCPAVVPYGQNLLVVWDVQPKTPRRAPGVPSLAVVSPRGAVVMPAKRAATAKRSGSYSGLTPLHDGGAAWTHVDHKADHIRIFRVPKP